MVCAFYILYFYIKKYNFKVNDEKKAKSFFENICEMTKFIPKAEKLFEIWLTNRS